MYSILSIHKTETFDYIKCPVKQIRFLDNVTIEKYLNLFGRRFTMSTSSFQGTIVVPEYMIQDKPLWFHKMGLMQTATGYGSKLRSSKMVKIKNRMRRIYYICWSNVATYYVIVGGKKYILRVD